MAELFLWLEALAGLHALYDLVEAGVGYGLGYERYRNQRSVIAEAERARAVLSTYSDREVGELIKRIEGCRDRFIEQGAGKDRARCLCNILEQIKDGNGGDFPVLEWDRMYNQLHCER
jgi:hypothetical protein